MPAPVTRPSSTLVHRPRAAPVPACRNCGVALRGPYCHACGQAAEPRIVPFRRFVARGVSQHFGLDGRVMRTLAALILRPGTLTSAYLAGRYVRQVHPLRLYLVVSALYFFVVARHPEASFVVFSEDPGEPMVAAFIELLPTMMIVGMPAVALVLRGLYRGRVYLEHFVFTLHVFAFVYIMGSLAGAVDMATAEADEWTLRTVSAEVFVALARLSMPAYVYLALRHVYGEARARTLLKAVFFGIGTLLILVALTVATAALFVG